MTAGLKPYPTYKEAGVGVLGQVPADWVIRSLGQLGRFSKGAGGTKDDEVSSGVPCVRYGDLYTQGEFFITATRSFLDPETAENYALAQPGDVLFAASGETIDEIGKSAVNLISGEVRVGGDVILLRPHYPVDWRFLGYACEAETAVLQKSRMGKGVTVMHIYPHALRHLQLPLPPAEEQAAIVRYLDHIDARIQRFIAAKERLIELLQEEKQAIINRAVTRGLDPDVPLKPSGIDWLPNMPADWKATRVKSEFVCLNDRRRPLSSTERGERQGPYPYYGASGVIDHVDDYLFDDDLILVAEDGANLVLRNLPLAIVAQGQFWVNNHAHILKPRHGHVQYLQAVMESVDYRPYISGAAQPKLTKDRILAIPIAVPRLADQVSIMDRVQSLIEPEEEAARRARQHITLLRQYRTRLISDVVTGRLDVRAAAAKLPADLGVDDPALDEQLEEAIA